MLRQSLRFNLVALPAFAFYAYPAIFDFATQFIARNQLMDPETSHNAFTEAAEWGILPDYRHWNWRYGGSSSQGSSRLVTEVFGRTLPSPIGVAAGLDKNARMIDPLFGLGFGFVEIGSVTPKPQEGNEKPRVFRLVEDEGIINRYGFNSDGAAVVRERLAAYRKSQPKTEGMLGINLGKNKTTEVASEDYIKAMKELGEFGDYLVINISSPNTAGLRSLQGLSEMEQLITAIQSEKNNIESLKDKPLLVKIAPDLNPQELHDIAQVSLRTNIDGLIVSNTTISRPDTLISHHKVESGGLSGKPLKARSLQVLKDIHALTNGKITLISVGGVETGMDAYERIQAGASLIQVYSAMTFQGPGLASRINDELNDILKSKNIGSVNQIRSPTL